MLPSKLNTNTEYIFDYHILYDDDGSIVYFDNNPPQAVDEYNNLLIPNNTVYVDFILSEPNDWRQLDFCIRDGKLAWLNIENKNDIKLARVRNQALNMLSQTIQKKLSNVPRDEQKAKTLLLGWLEAGSIGDKPQYWIDWKSARDSIATEYDEYKVYILDNTRTIEELEYLVWSEAGLEIVKPEYLTEPEITVFEEIEPEPNQAPIAIDTPPEDAELDNLDDTQNYQDQKIEFIPPP